MPLHSLMDLALVPQPSAPCADCRRLPWQIIDHPCQPFEARLCLGCFLLRREKARQHRSDCERGNIIRRATMKIRQQRLANGQCLPKAWRIVWKGMPEEKGIYIAKTRGGARNKAVRQLKEIGVKARFRDISAVRAPEYDAWAAKQGEHRQQVGMSEEYVRKEIASC